MTTLPVDVSTLPHTDCTFCGQAVPCVSIAYRSELNAICNRCAMDLVECIVDAKDAEPDIHILLLQVIRKRMVELATPPGGSS